MTPEEQGIFESWSLLHRPLPNHTVDHLRCRACALENIQSSFEEYDHLQFETGLLEPLAEVSQVTLQQQILQNANRAFGDELIRLWRYLEISKIIGLNVDKIRVRKANNFLAFTQRMSDRLIAISVLKLLERPSPNQAQQLCSLRGIMNLSSPLKLSNKEALENYLAKFDLAPTNNWVTDVEKVFKKHQELVVRCLNDLKPMRNSAVAHLQLPSTGDFSMTSCGHLEELFEFLEGFHNFIECAFFGGPWTVNVKAPLVATSLTDTLSELGISKVISDFTD